MVSDFILKISDIAQVYDGPHATPQKIDDGPYFLSISSLEKGQLDLSKSAHLSEEQFKKWTKRVTPQEGDVLFSYETRLGEAALMPSGVKACLGRRMGLLRPDRNKVLPEYLLYAYLSPTFQQEIKKRTIYGATVERISLREFPDFNIRIPTLHEQAQVVKALIAIDGKLVLNNQTNQTLEQMAQTLFKSWFVDFDPVFDNLLAKANYQLTNLPADFPEELHPKAVKRLAALSARIPSQEHESERLASGNESENTPLPHPDFPSEFEFNEQLGWVPLGWEAAELSELISIKHGFAYKGEFFSDSETDNILLTPGNVGVGGGFKNAKYKYYNGPINNDYIFNAGDMYVTMTDLSKASDTLGYPAIVPSIEGITFHHNQRLGKIIYSGHKSAQKEFIYQNLCSYNSRNNVLGSATGTTVKHTSPTKILSLIICHSGGNIESIFETHAKALYEKSAENNLNIISLIKLRDTLLPKLISGELQILDLEPRSHALRGNA